MDMECFRKHSLNFWQGKDGFCKSVELHLGQSLYRGSHALYSSTTGDEPVSALLPFAFLTVGNPVFILLHLVLELDKLLFTGCPLGFQLE